MACRGGGSNTTQALLSPDPETLPMGEGVLLSLGTKMLQGQRTVPPHAPLMAGLNSHLGQGLGPVIIP